MADKLSTFQEPSGRRGRVIQPFNPGNVAIRPDFSSLSQSNNTLVNSIVGFVKRKEAEGERFEKVRFGNMGAQAAANADLQQKDLQSLFSQDGGFRAHAFNQSLIAGLSARFKAQVSTDIDKFKNNPNLRANPDAMGRAISDYRGKLLEQAPAQLHPDIIPFLDLHTGTAQNSSIVGQQKAVVDANKAQFEQYKKSQLNTILNLQEEGQFDAAGKLEKEYFNELDKQGPLEFGGTGVYTAKGLGDQKLAFRQQMRISALRGEFRRIPGFSGKMAFLNRLSKPGNKELDDLFTPKEQASIRSELRTIVTQENAAFNSSIARRNFLMKEKERTAIKAYIGVKSDPDSSDEQLNASLQNVYANAFGLDTIKFVDKEATDINDEAADQEYTTRFFGPDEKAGNDLTINDVVEDFRLGRVKAPTARRWIDKLENAKDFPFLKSSGWKQAIKFRNNDFPVNKNLMGGFSSAQSRKNAAVRTEIEEQLFNVMKANPDKDPVAAYQSIKNQRKAAGSQKTSLVDKHFGTGDAVNQNWVQNHKSYREAKRLGIVSPDLQSKYDAYWKEKAGL